MFDFVRRHNRLLQFGLVVVIFPSFVAFGIQGYQSFDERTHAVAEVDGQPITQTEWDAAHRQQAERMRASNPTMDAKLLDSPVIKQRVLDDMVRERVLLAAMRDLRLEPTDQRLQRLFQADPQFAPLRNPDGSVRKELLEMRGMSSAQFASQLRFELGLRQVMLGLGASVPATAAVAARATEPYFQQREIRVVSFSPREQEARIKLEDADLKAFYEDPRNAARFQAPEQVAVDYLVLDMAAAMREVRVDEAELRKYYEENIARFEQPQERRARHILIKVDAGADDKTRAAAKAKAEALLARLKGERAAFADIARKESNDPGSAAQGGDLDWIQRGAMVKPFEDAVFSMKKGELGELVQTEFGWHIIEVTDARGGERKPFETVRAELDAEYRKQQGGKRFAELAEQFADQVEQEDQLKPVADKLKLTLRSVDKVVRGVSAGLPPELAHAKVQEVLFDAQTVGGKRNSDPIDIGTNQLLALHVRSHVPAHRMSVEELGDRLRSWTLEAKAAAAAVEAGKAALAQWRESGDALAQGKSAIVSRVGASEQPRELIDAVLRAPSDKLPAWVGVDLGAKGYAVARIDKVIAPDAAVIDPKAAAGQYAQLWTQAENDAYYQALRKRYKVEINAPAPSPATP